MTQKSNVQIIDEMKFTPEMQLERLNTLFHLTKVQLKVNHPVELLKTKKGRTPSSLEEEMLTYLPMFDQKDESEIGQKTLALIQEKGIPLDRVIDEKVVHEIQKHSPELAMQLKSLGITNVEKILQGNFYDSSMDLWKLAKGYEFPAEYQKITAGSFGNQSAAIIEEYAYAPSSGYRSMLYHMLRHSTNLTGAESPKEIEQLARKVFGGKKVLELGSGPGFYLHLLHKFGAEVTGVESNEKLKDIPQVQNAKSCGVNLIFGDAENLESLLDEHTKKQKFDLVFSKDFISFAVTKDSAEPILTAVYNVMKPGAIAIHQIGYKRVDEEKYFQLIERMGQAKGVNVQKIKESFQQIPEDQKEMLLRQNIFNIGPGSIERIGYELMTGFKLDLEENLLLTMRKPY